MSGTKGNKFHEREPPMNYIEEIPVWRREVPPSLISRKPKTEGHAFRRATQAYPEIL